VSPSEKLKLSASTDRFLADGELDFFDPVVLRNA
jgi:hypothetical protein